MIREKTIPDFQGKLRKSIQSMVPAANSSRCQYTESSAKLTIWQVLDSPKTILKIDIWLIHPDIFHVQVRCSSRQKRCNSEEVIATLENKSGSLLSVSKYEGLQSDPLFEFSGLQNYETLFLGNTALILTLHFRFLSSQLTTQKKAKLLMTRLWFALFSLEF